MKKLVLLFFVSHTLLYHHSFSQKSFKPATLILANGDSASGFIRYHDWQMTPSRITFRKQMNSANESFKPADIKRFVVNGETYTSAVVDLDFRYDDLQRMNIDEVIHTHSDTLFLKTEISGSRPLYSYKDHVYHFYIAVQDTLRLLRFKKYKSYASSEVAYLGHGRVVRMQDTYLWQLQEYLAGCNAAMPAIVNTEYTLKGMKTTFKAYQDCMKLADTSGK